MASRRISGAKRNSLDHGYMAICLDLARARLGLTTPNPAVGCVLVNRGRIVGRGATASGGRPHAETIALARAGKSARGATAYVSFEPCAHFGRTPPCALALRDAGVARVVIGCVDPDPRVSGRGLAILRRAGIEVVRGVREQECLALNRGFITRVRRGRPAVTLKLALSLDGRIAAAGGDSRWISSEQSRALVHRWRREADAVMVGAATVIVDDPRLTCRMAHGRDPVRIVIDGRLRTSPRARIFRQRSAAPTILATTARNLSRARRRHAGQRVEVLAVAAGRAAGTIALDRLMRELGARGWCNVLIEGGAHLAADALLAGCVDRVAFILAPRIIGDGRAAVEGMRTRRVLDAVRIAHLSARPVGEDYLLEGDVEPPVAR